MSLVQGVFLISNILGIFSVSKLMNIFFEREGINRWVELFSYIIYYVLSVLIFINLPVPIVFLLFNIISIFIITFNYRGTLKHRIMAGIYIYLITFAVEIILMSLFEYKKIFIFRVQELRSAYLIICTNVLVYIISIILSERKFSIKKSGDISVLYWIGVLSIPIASLVIMLLFLNIATGHEQLKMIQTDNENISLIKHDIQNHLFMLKSLYERGRNGFI